jgi:hypothetical protein
MALRDVQIALATRIAMPTPDLSGKNGQQAWWHSLHLTPAEQAWFEQIMDSPGMQLTCDVQRWWRRMRLQSSVRLTLAVLPPQQRLAVIQAYVTSEPCTSLFFIPEALQFLEFVLQTAPDVPYLQAVARFEQALFRAKEAQDTLGSALPEGIVLLPTHRLRRHTAAALILFPAHPEWLLSALLQGTTDLPAPDGHQYPVLVAPGLPHLWRQATSEEVEIFTVCQVTTTVEHLPAALGSMAEPLHTLVAARALSVEPAPPAG